MIIFEHKNIQINNDGIDIQTNENEEKILTALFSIADKIDYKVLSDKEINIVTTDEVLKPYWNGMQQNFMSEVSYDVEYIKHDSNSTKKDALRTYIDFKKSELSPEVKTTKATISATNNPFNDETLKEISELTLASPFMKPVEINQNYYTFKLEKVNHSKPKSYEEAKEEVKTLYVQEQKRTKLQELAKNSYETFKGTQTDFITQLDADKLKLLPSDEARKFLNELFMKQNKRGFVEIGNGKIVLYNILEQKMLEKPKQNESLAQLKGSIFNDGLLSKLKNKYNTEIFIEGL